MPGVREAEAPAGGRRRPIGFLESVMGDIPNEKPASRGFHHGQRRVSGLNIRKGSRSQNTLASPPAPWRRRRNVFAEFSL